MSAWLEEHSFTEPIRPAIAAAEIHIRWLEGRPKVKLPTQP